MCTTIRWSFPVNFWNQLSNKKGRTREGSIWNVNSCPVWIRIFPITHALARTYIFGAGTMTLFGKKFRTFQEELSVRLFLGCLICVFCLRSTHPYLNTSLVKLAQFAHGLTLGLDKVARLLLTVQVYLPWKRLEMSRIKSLFAHITGWQELRLSPLHNFALCLYAST